MRFQALTLVSLAAFAAASPLIPHDKSNSCNSILSRAGQYVSFRPLASYCSSFLQIPAVTTTIITTKTITSTLAPTVCPTKGPLDARDNFAASCEVALTVTGLSINEQYADHHPDQAVFKRTPATATMTVQLHRVRSAAELITTETIVPIPMSTALASSACSCVRLETPTVTSTHIVTSIATKSLPTIIGVPTATACKNVNVNGFVYTNYFNGCGVTENYNNPGNTGPSRYAAFTTTFKGSLDRCDAVQRCVIAAYSQSFVHYSFDLHCRRSTGRWECVQYFDWNDDHTQFHVVDDDVEAAYGYSVQ